MKTSTSLSLLWLLATPLFAADRVDQSLDVSAPVTLELKVQRGEVDIIPWSESKVQVQGTLDELSEGLVFTLDDGRVLLEDKLPRQYNGKHNQGSKLQIRVPVNMDLQAEGISVDYRLSGLEGELKLSTVSGDIEAKELRGKVKFNTVSGNIDGRGLDASLIIDTVSGSIKASELKGMDARIKSVSGDIELQSEHGSVRIEQVSGDTKAELPQAHAVQYNAVSGDAELALKGDVKISAESVSGNITIKLTSTADVRVSIDGGPGGKISNELSSEQPKSPKYGPGSKLDMRLGDGKGVIELTTLSGTLSLK